MAVNVWPSCCTVGVLTDATPLLSGATADVWPLVTDVLALPAVAVTVTSIFVPTSVGCRVYCAEVALFWIGVQVPETHCDHW